jgi:2-polyprenyl-3-methyl-5-hydroxy-6-metoxy-1,4-benzoquinol methylase
VRHRSRFEDISGESTRGLDAGVRPDVSSPRDPALISIDPEKREILALFELSDLDRKHVLEIGPGTGRLTWRYADRAAHVTAVDPWVDGIRRARRTAPTALAKRIEFHPTAFLDFADDHGPSVYDVAILSWSLC